MLSSHRNSGKSAIYYAVITSMNAQELGNEAKMRVALFISSASQLLSIQSL